MRVKVMTMKTSMPRILIACWLSTLAVMAQADSNAGHAQIAAAVYDHLLELHGDDNNSRVDIEISNLDPRLRIHACESPLDTRLNQQQRPIGRVTVRVECHDAHASWTRHVPAMIRVYTPVLISARALQRGEILGSADLQMQEMELSAIRQTALRSADEAAGMQTRRTVPAGTAMTAEMLTPAILVERGDSVTITAERGGISIRQQGVAMQNGEMGGRISVRNTSSDRVVQAVVIGNGQVSVNF